MAPSNPIQVAEALAIEKTAAGAYAYGRIRLAEAAGISHDQARRVIDRVRKADRGALAAAPVVVGDDGDPVADLLDLLGKRRDKGVSTSEASGFDGALQELERRGYTLALLAGRIILEKSPEARTNEEAVRGIFDPTRQVHRFAVISDTHFGGFQAQPAFVRAILEEAARRNCSAVLHVGDHVDGPPSMHKGFEYELGLTQADEQVDFAVSIYQQSQVPILGIGGNHDGSFFKAAGLDVCRLMAERCEQFTYIGPISGWVAGPSGDENFIRLFHPGDGCSYALSYKDQKTAEFLALSNDKSPTGFHFTGHYHKMNHMRGPNGARYFLTPASCATTPFMRAKRLVNQSGAYFIEFTIDAAGRVDRCIVEDVILFPSSWTRCDYSQSVRPARLAPGRVWAA